MKLPATLRRTPLTWLVPVLWLVVQVAGAAGHLELRPDVGPLALLSGALTAALAHTGWGHLAANATVWVVYAPKVEGRLRWWTAAVLVAGQAAGVVAHLCSAGSSALVGGSFLAAACMGAYLVLPSPDLRRAGLAVVVLGLEAGLALGHDPGPASHWGHVAAAVAGALVALVVGRYLPGTRNCGPEGPQSE